MNLRLFTFCNFCINRYDSELFLNCFEYTNFHGAPFFVEIRFPEL